MGSAIATPGADARIQNREISFDLDSAQPPINQYISKDDSLFIMCSNNSVATLNVTVFARMMMPDGTLQQNQWPVTAQPQRAGNFTAIPLPECFLMSCSATANVAFGQGLYVEATIARGIPALGFQHLVLFKGFPTNSMPLSWPWGVNQTNLDCAGSIRSITGTTPAAGAEISETVPTFAKWQLLAIRIILVASGVAGNRTVILNFDDGTNVFARQGNINFQPASSTVDYNFAPNYAGVVGLASTVYLQMPNPLFLMPGFRIRTTTTGIDVGDQYASPKYVVQEWLLP